MATEHVLYIFVFLYAVDSLLITIFRYKLNDELSKNIYIYFFFLFCQWYVLNNYPSQEVQFKLHITFLDIRYCSLRT